MDWNWHFIAHMSVLHALWNTSKQEAEETVDVLWARVLLYYVLLLWASGLVQFTDSRLSPDSITHCCVKVHAVISQSTSLNLWTVLRY